MAIRAPSELKTNTNTETEIQIQMEQAWEVGKACQKCRLANHSMRTTEQNNIEYESQIFAQIFLQMQKIKQNKYKSEN